MGSNHDFSRLSSRWAGGDAAKAGLALLLLLTLRGTPFLYQGDEIGQVDGVIEREELLDPVGLRFFPYAGRDPSRTPMPWHSGPGAGFTDPAARPWLPITDPAACNVADQEGDPDSVLELCRRVIAARRASEDIAVGGYISLPSPPETWAYRRGEATDVLLNMSTDPATFDHVQGTVTVATDRRLEGSAIEGGLTLAPWSGAVVER
jgi:alpha-glucosidase